MLYVKKDIILVCSILSVTVLLTTSINYLPITTFDIDWESSRFSTQKKKQVNLLRDVLPKLSIQNMNQYQFYYSICFIKTVFFLQNKSELVSIHYNEYSLQ